MDAIREVNGVKVDERDKQGTSASIIGKNFNTFLTILTTQLKNQDPLSPMDTTKFTDQLVNFTQVEQQVATNSKLDSLLKGQSSNQLTAAVSYIGKEVEAAGDAVFLKDGNGKIGYGLKRSSAKTTITVLDAQGRLVRTLKGSTKAGNHVVKWDGTDDTGRKVADGTYRVSVTALDGKGKTMESTSTTFGKVSGVEIDGGKVTLIMGSLSVDLNKIISVHQPAPDPKPQGKSS